MLFRYLIAAVVTMPLVLSTIIVGCSDDDGTTIQPVDYSGQWVGAWQYMYVDGDGLLVPAKGVWQNHTQSRVDRKIIFNPEGTWQLSYDNDVGTYIVIGNRFHIDRKTGSWVRDGDILKLIYDESDIQILKKTDLFQKYTPSPDLPDPPRLPFSATTATSNPAAGSELMPNAKLTINLDEAVDAVTVNGTAATGSGRRWSINLAGLNLPPGATTLNIGWTNKDGTAGVGARLSFTIQREWDRIAPEIVSATVHNGDRNVKLGPLNANGIRIRFSEDVKESDISISVEGGDSLNWLAEWTHDAVIIAPAKGAELGNETTYEIKVWAEDGSGNVLFTTISFTTEVK